MTAWRRTADQPETRGMTVATSLAAAIQSPLSGTLGGDEEEDEAIQDSKLAVVERREESTAEVASPVELHIGNRHLATAEERDPAGSVAQQNGHATQQLNDPAYPKLRAHARRGHLAEHTQHLLHAVETEHEAADDAQESG